MLIVKVKICGITNYDDAIAAVDMGADLLGFNFHPQSPRSLSIAQATEIISRLPAFAETVALFVNAPFKQIQQTLDALRFDWIQLHGDETPQFCSQFRSVNVRTMKALRVKDQADIDRAQEYFTDAILLDAYDPTKYGGTGLTFDWNIIGDMSKRVFLAGGINPDNAVKAVELGVYGIDVCSGVESAPGKKDLKKMKKLFDNIRHLRG